MGFILKLILISIPIGLALLYRDLNKTDPIPKVDDEYWGPKSDNGVKEDSSIRPFKIDVPHSDLDDLKARLKNELASNRLVPPLEGIGFEYGFNSKFLKTVGQHWLDKYDWREREKLLNKYPQFKTTIGGLDIHFYHIKSKEKNGQPARPVLIIHGWPGSVVEYQKIIPFLSEPKDSKYNYELIIPSLPGFGFSSPASRPGLSTVEIANILKRLIVDRLGHQRFFVMGADFGALISSDISTLYSQHVIAALTSGCFDMSSLGHLKHFVSATIPSIFAPPKVAKKVTRNGDFLSLLMGEMGYLHIQATKVDTLGVALTHSPLGLAAYILEKFSTWTNKKYITREDGGLLEKFGVDELLDNVMIYWISSSITTSQRLYAETFLSTKKHNLDRVPTKVPYYCLFMPEDIVVLPEWALNAKYRNIKKHSIAPNGGHFFAFESDVTELVAKEATSFFDTFSK